MLFIVLLDCSTALLIQLHASLYMWQGGEQIVFNRSKNVVYERLQANKYELKFMLWILKIITSIYFQ